MRYRVNEVGIAGWVIGLALAVWIMWPAAQYAAGGAIAIMVGYLLAYQPRPPR